MENAIVLCSGGLDSVVTAHYVAKKFKPHMITILFFDYGQRNIYLERKHSNKCSRVLRAKFLEMKLSNIKFISTSLLNKKKKSVEVRRADLKNSELESDKWYVPCRNLIFISNAMALAESIYLQSGIKSDIFVGFKNDGKESFPDASADFVARFNKLISISSKTKCKIKAPLIKKDKEDIINLGLKLGVNFQETFSCYVGSKIHCGTCLACRLRQEGFYWANVKDPTKYLKRMTDFRMASV